MWTDILILLCALTAMVAATAYLVSRPCLLRGRRCLEDGFDKRFHETQRSFRRVVLPALRDHVGEASVATDPSLAA